MNHIARKCAACLFLLFIVAACAQLSNDTKKYEEVPPMLTVLTNVAHSAVEKGYYDRGEQAVLEYISQKKPKFAKWFEDRDYKIMVSEVANHAIVLVCDDGKAVFEDTYCSAGFPDKDHRGKGIPCQLTMTEEEVKQFCR